MNPSVAEQEITIIDGTNLYYTDGVVRCELISDVFIRWMNNRGSRVVKQIKFVLFFIQEHSPGADRSETLNLFYSHRHSWPYIEYESEEIYILYNYIYSSIKLS